MFVYRGGTGEILGYAFCVWEVYSDHNTMVDRKTLYIDDICVDEGARGRHIGSTLYEHVLNYAREQGFYNVTLKLPAQEPNTKIRFTFDNVSEATASQCYIEGTYIRTNGKGQLTDIRYVGLECKSGVAVTASSEGIFDVFAFRDLTDLNGAQISTDYVKQWNWLESGGQWQYNSEFTPSGNTEVVNEYKSAMIMLVLDCSSSLGSDFVNMKTAANGFIETLSGNYNGR